MTQPRCDTLRIREISIRDDDGRSFLMGEMRYGRADAACCARGDRNLAFNLHLEFST